MNINHKIKNLDVQIDPRINQDKIDIKENKKCYHSIQQWLLEYFCAFSGFLCVHATAKYGKLEPVFSCGIFVLMFSLMSPASYIPIFFSSCLCGVMNPEKLVNIGFIFFTGIIILIIYHLFANLLLNIGGRPGTIALLSNLTTLLIEYLIGLSGIYEFNIPPFLYKQDEYNSLNVYIFIFAPLWATLASFLVHLIAEVREDIVKITHRITAYGFTNILGLIFLITFTLEYTSTTTYGSFYAGFWHIGCLAGLTIKPRFKAYLTKYHFHHYLIVGYLSGWIAIGFVGLIIIGGKHGFLAFLGNNIYLWIIELIYKCFSIQEKTLSHIETNKNCEEIEIKDKKSLDKFERNLVFLYSNRKVYFEDKDKIKETNANMDNTHINKTL